MIKTILMLEDGTEIMAGYNKVNAIQNFSIEENCNSGDDLTLGSVCSKKITVNIISPQNKLQIKYGEKITVYEEQNEERRKKGIFVAEKPQRKTANTTNVVAYDNISLLDKDVTEWFNSLNNFPYSAFNMAKIVCEHCGLNLLNTDLRNGDFQINEVKLESVTGRQIIQWIGEICGYFCIANEDGDVLFRWYENNEKTICIKKENANSVFLEGSLIYEDYDVKNIDRVQIRQTEDDVGVSYPKNFDGGNVYIVQSNPFIMSSQNSVDVEEVAQNLYILLKDASYTPCRVSIPSSFDFNIGDIIKITDANGVEFFSYIMRKHRSGQKETIESAGNAERNGATELYRTSFSSEYGKTLSIQKDIDGLRVTNEIIGKSLAELEIAVNENESKIAFIAEWIGDEDGGMTKTIATLSARADASAAAITSITSWQDRVGESVAKITQETDANGAKIGMVVKSGEFGDYVDGSVLIEAINGESVAKISADRIVLDGYLTVGANISDLTDDIGYAVQSDIPTKLSELENDGDFATTWDIPTTLSALTDDVGYATEDGVVTIVNGIVTADYVAALGVVAVSLVSNSLNGNNSVIIQNGEFSMSQYYNNQTFSSTMNAAFYRSYNPYNGKYFFCGNGNAATSGVAQVGWSTSHYIMFGPSNAQLIGTWLGTSSAAITSDAGKKHDITDMDDRYSAFFDLVRPVAYKYNDGTSGRYHTGFIANEVETALETAGISTEEFAGFVRADVINEKTGETETVNCLRYEEFIAVLWHEVQRLKATLSQ